MMNITEVMQSIARRVDLILRKNYPGDKRGFCVIVFNFNNPGISHYVSNADREDMIKALRETADRLEKRQDNPR